MENTLVMKLNSVGYLRLAYIATEISLHRRILLALFPSTDPQLYRICRSVAHERFMFAIDFVQSLKPQHLSSFWYFASPQNFALIGVFGTLLLSTASSPEEGDFYRTKLREYRWTLKINSENGARYMKPAMALLDANMGLLEESSSNHTLTRPAPTPTTGLEQRSIESRSIASESTDHYTFTNAQLSMSGTADFHSPSQFSFDTPFYSGQHPDDTSPAAYGTQGNADTQPQDFGFGGNGNAGMWSY